MSAVGLATDAGSTANGGTPRPPRGRGDAPALVMALLGCALGACWVAAQRVAAHYGYAAWLGEPLVATSGPAVLGWRLLAIGAAGAAAATALRVRRTRPWGPAVVVGCLCVTGMAALAARGPLYDPLQGLTWVARLYELSHRAAGASRSGPVRGASGRLYYPAHAATPVAVVPPAVAAKAGVAVRAYTTSFAMTFVALLVGVAVARPPRRRRVASASHGSAAWGDGAGLRTTLVPGPVLGNGTGEPLGLLLGHADASARGAGKGGAAPAVDVLRYVGDGHLITIAPTRTGKGVSAIVPNLLFYAGSVVVTDPKGENYTVTRRRRRDARQHVWALDPFGITDAARHDERGAVNPLDIIDAQSVDAPDDAALLADMLTLPEDTVGSGAGDVHFEPEARALLGTLILYVAATEKPGKRRSLPRVRELVTLPPEDFTKLLATMRACGEPQQVALLGHAGTLIARGAARLQSKAEKERSGVISTAQRYTHFLDSRRMMGVLERTTVPLDVLREGRLSLYLVLPTERLSTYRAWMRLMVGVCLRVMVHQGSGQALATPHEKSRVLFALDEFANLKRLAPVEDAFTIAAGYGVTFWLFLQDLAQLKAQYRQSWNSFIANAEVLQTFGTNDVDTAEYLSKLTGDATILVEGENLSASVSHGHQSSRQESTSQSVSEKGRRLLTPDEVRRLPLDEALVFLRSQPPLRVRKLHYGRDAAFVGLYDRPAAAPQAGTALPPDASESAPSLSDALAQTAEAEAAVA